VHEGESVTDAGGGCKEDDAKKEVRAPREKTSVPTARI